MAVELKCPDCSAKLRLKVAPEAGTEIECPKCTHVFSAPRLDDEDEPLPKKKKRPAPDTDDEAKPRRKKKKAGKGNAKAKSDQPKKRRAKKKETNPMVLVGVILFGLMVLGLVVTLLVWFLGRKPAAYEMLNYVPEDAHSVTGLNISHIQKYPEFFKSCEQAYATKGFKLAGDAFAKALGSEANDVLDYMVYAESLRGDTLILRTKTEYDTDALSKLPGAKKQSLDGHTYYLISDIAGMTGITRTRVFAPTNRLVVFCAGSIPDSVFKNMMNGYEGNEKSMNVRSGELGKRVTRGTWWGLRLFDTNPKNKPAPPPKVEQSGTGMPIDEGDRATKEIASTTTSSAKGYGFKISVGSRTMRLEVDVWMRDEESATSMYDKFKESTLAKGDEEEPPRWWKKFMQGLGDKKIGNELLTNVGAKASGEVFIFYSELDTKLMMTALGSLVNKVVPEEQQPGS